MAATASPYNKPVLPRVSDTSDLASNRASVYSGKALSFDGANDDIAVGNKDIFKIYGGEITIACWIKHDYNGGTYEIFRIENNSTRILFSFQIGNILSFGTYDGASYTELDVSITNHLPAIDNVWAFVAVTHDASGNRKMYLNGELIGSDTRPGAITAYGTATPRVGSNAGSTEWYLGQMSGFKFFDVALTQSQIQELYNNPETIVPSGQQNISLKCWFPMMEGAGSYVYNGAAGSLGTELVSNGGFDEVCQKWGLSDVATIAITGGKAVWTNPASGGAFADQYISATTGKTYRVTFDYTASDSGFVYIGDQYVSIPSGNGTFTTDITYTSGNARVRFAYGSSSALTASIDNVSVKEVVPQATGTISGATWVAGLPEPLPQTALMDWNKATNRSEYSEDLTQTAWTKNGVTATAASIVSPLGTTGGVFNVVPSTTNAIHLIQDGSYSVGNGSYYVASAWFKANGYRYAFLSFSGYGNWTGSNGAEVLFDLYNGTASPTGGAPYAYGIEPYADGWYKCYTIAQATTSFSTNVNFFVSNGTTSTSFVGDGTSGLYMFGLQSQIATTVGTYVPTYASAQTSPVLIPKGLTTGKDIFGNSIAVSRSAGAFNFDGKSWVQFQSNNSLEISGAITLEFWAKWNARDVTPNYDHAIGRRDSSDSNWLRIYKASNNSILLEGYNGTSISGATAADGTWYHVVATLSGTDAVLYINGTAYNSGSLTWNVVNEAAPWTIGTWINSTTPVSNSYTYGDIANPRIYNFALTAEQVADNYNQKATTFGGSTTISELQAYINRTNAAGATVEAHPSLLNTLTELESK